MDKHVWIRKSDLPIWESIRDKPEWLHFMLTEPRVVKEWEAYWYANDPNRVKIAGKKD